MKYHAYPPYDLDNVKSKFNFRKIFNNEQWQRVPYHAKNIIINLGHLIDRNYFHKSYVSNKNEPRRLADIYNEQNNYFELLQKINLLNSEEKMINISKNLFIYANKLYDFEKMYLKIEKILNEKN